MVGGLIILWAEKRKHTERITTVDAIQPTDSFKIGLFQLLALFPGTSRSAATILGGPRIASFEPSDASRWRPWPCRR